MNITWEGNPTADKKTFTVEFAQGTAVLEALQKIAARRGERLTKSRNYVAITSPARLPARATYRQKGKDSAADLERWVIAVIPCSVAIFVIEPQDDDVESFINAKLQESWALSKKGTTPFCVKMSGNARRKVSAVNFIGTWTYLDLFEAIALTADLRWRIDGNVIYFQE